MAQLFELLTNDENRQLAAMSCNGIKWDTELDIREMTVKQLGRISLMLIETEYNGKVPECVLSAEAINILTKRAIEKNIPIF